MARPDGETRDPARDAGAGSRRVWMVGLPFLAPPLTYNELMGKHWSAVHRAKRDLVNAGFYLSRTKHAVTDDWAYAGVVDLDLSSPRRAAMPRPFTEPVSIEMVYWPGDNTVHDPDNLAPTLKYLVDGLRRSGVLTDDRGKFVRTAACTVIERADDHEDRADARMALVVREL